MSDSTAQLNVEVFFSRLYELNIYWLIEDMLLQFGREIRIVGNPYRVFLCRHNEFIASVKSLRMSFDVADVVTGEYVVVGILHYFDHSVE